MQRSRTLRGVRCGSAATGREEVPASAEAAVYSVAGISDDPSTLPLQRTLHPVDTLVDSPQSTLSGVARVLVHAGRLGVKNAEESGQERQGQAHRLCVGGDRAPAPSPRPISRTRCRRVWPCRCWTSTPSMASGFRAISSTASWRHSIKSSCSAKRGNRLFIGGADPTDQEAVERIKFATQLSPEWVIVEHDKLAQTARNARDQRHRSARVDGLRRVRLRRHRRRAATPGKQPMSSPRSKTRRSCASCRRC